MIFFLGNRVTQKEDGNLRIHVYDLEECKLFEKKFNQEMEKLNPVPEPSYIKRNSHKDKIEIPCQEEFHTYYKNDTVTFICDGIDTKNKTIYEFNGD